ncbi:unnamed protein product [Rotaria socialis]|uniref:Uncharacterized protein n=1 Tax=Rotaria socialis TaxID=392032 RepID=A0A821T0I4_9BILA|nr:unnamed protein product [Rotaria socialis]CAF4864951.1 unnamed protein product [Rotaria socialis]
MPKHPKLNKFVHEKSFKSLAESVEFHEEALNNGRYIKGFFTSDDMTLKAAHEILAGNPYETFLTGLLLKPPSQSIREQRSREITLCAIENFPEYLPEYNKYKNEISLVSVGGPAALDTSLIASINSNMKKMQQNIYISGPFSENRHLTGHALMWPFLVRSVMGCPIEEALHPDFRKIDMKFSSITPEKLNIYLRNEFNWLWQAVRYRFGLMTEHDLNRLESALSQELLHRIEHVIGVNLSSNANRDPKQSISIHVDLTQEGSEATRAENRLMKETKNVVQATRYPTDGNLFLEAQCIEENIIMNNGGQCLKQHISRILFVEDKSLSGKARLAGIVTESGQFIYASHLHLSPGYKAKFKFGTAKKSTFYRNLTNKLKNQFNIDPPVPGHHLTVATGTSINAIMRNDSHLKRIIATYGTTPQYAVTNSHWTMLAKNENYILMRITGGGTTGEENYNPAYFLNLIANTERLFGPEALVGILSTYGCPRSINARNSTEFFKANNVLISYGKGGTGNNKRHAEAVIALLELGFDKTVTDLFEHCSTYDGKSMTQVIKYIHEKSKDMRFIYSGDAHINRRLGYDGKLTNGENLSLLCFIILLFGLFRSMLSA